MKALYNLFLSNSPLAIGMIFLITVLLWIPSLLSGNELLATNYADQMPLFGLLLRIFEGSPTGAVVFAYVLFLMTAFLLDYLNTRFILVQERTYLPAWFFIVITSFYPGLYHLTPILPVALLFVVMLHLIFAGYKSEANSYRFFDAGLILGIASLFYAPAIWFILFIWISVIIIRPFYWRELLYPVLGIFIILLLSWSFYYVLKGDANHFFILLSSNLSPSFLKKVPDIKVIVGTAYLIMMILFSSFFMLRVFKFRKVYARNYFNVFFWLFMLSIIFFFFPSGGNYGIVYLVSFPVAYIITNYFINTRKSAGNRLLFFLGFLLVIFVIMNRYLLLL